MDEKRVMIDVDHVSIRFNLSNQKVDNLKEYFVKLLKKLVDILHPGAAALGYTLAAAAIDDLGFGSLLWSHSQYNGFNLTHFLTIQIYILILQCILDLTAYTRNHAQNLLKGS